MGLFLPSPGSHTGGQTTHVLEVRLITDRVMAVRQIVVTNHAHARAPLVRADVKDHGVNRHSLRHILRFLYNRQDVPSVVGRHTLTQTTVPQLT